MGRLPHAQCCTPPLGGVHTQQEIMQPAPQTSPHMGGCYSPEWVSHMHLPARVALARGFSNPSHMQGGSHSTHVGTRKVASYAWVGRSQGKLWWRFAASLTCKSSVRPEHRGERPIEPPSSWFPPNYPSGTPQPGNSPTL